MRTRTLVRARLFLGIALRVLALILCVVGLPLLALNQGFNFSAQSNCEPSAAGSSASDTTNAINAASVAASSAPINPARPTD